MTGESDFSKLYIEAEKRRREQIEAAAIEFEFPDWTSAEEEDYAKSLSPSDALARYPFEADLAVKQMQRELQYDRVQAIAHEAMVFDDKGGSFRHPLPLLHNWLWWQQMPHLDSDFWQTGYLEIAVPEKVGSLTFKARGRIRYFGVRFWPDGLPGGVDNPVASGNDASSDAALPLPTAEAERVAKALLNYWGKTLTEKRAVELARGMCPENRVSRDGFLEIFRAIRGPKMPGKQPSNGK